MMVRQAEMANSDAGKSCTSEDETEWHDVPKMASKEAPVTKENDTGCRHGHYCDC